MRSKNQTLHPRHIIFVAVVLVSALIILFGLFWGAAWFLKVNQPAVSEMNQEILPVEGEEDLSPGVTEQIETPVKTRQPSVLDIDSIISQMSLEEKVGQMILSGISGSILSEQDRSLVVDYHIGGVVYFAGNIESVAQTLQLSQQLQGAAVNNSQGIPLIISIDHEGGNVFRFQLGGATHFPSAMALGATDSNDLVYQSASAAALELKAVGINTSLGPVLDINDEPSNPVIGLRAFGGYPQLVSRLGVQYIRGLQDNGVIAFGKHFPGHGSTRVDSHISVPFIDKSIEMLMENELQPFSAAIENGVAGIMVGHIAIPQVDPTNRPSSLSHVFIQEILRENLAFDGVVMTDSMNMGAITESVGEQNAAVLAVQAGNDLLAFTSAVTAISAHQAVVAAVQNGNVQTERIDASVRRILGLKAQYGLFDQNLESSAIDVDYQSHMRLANQIASQAITIQGATQVPILNTSQILLISPGWLPVGSVSGDNLTLLGEELINRGIGIDEWIYPVDNPAQIEIINNQVSTQLASYTTVILVTWDAYPRMLSFADQSQINLLESVLSGANQVIVIAVNSPFDLSLVPSGVTALATFGVLDYQIVALVDALLSEDMPTGVMPVRLSNNP